MGGVSGDIFAVGTFFEDWVCGKVGFGSFVVENVIGRLGQGFVAGEHGGGFGYFESKFARAGQKIVPKPGPESPKILTCTSPAGC